MKKFQVSYEARLPKRTKFRFISFANNVKMTKDLMQIKVNSEGLMHGMPSTDLPYGSSLPTANKHLGHSVLEVFFQGLLQLNPFI